MDEEKAKAVVFDPSQLQKEAVLIDKQGNIISRGDNTAKLHADQRRKTSESTQG